MPPSSTITILPVAPGNSDLRRLIADLDRELLALYPPENVRGVSLAGAEALGLHCVVAYRGDEPLGCGCLRPWGEDQGELKRIYVAPSARRQGIALRLIRHLEREARRRGYHTLLLETGIHQPEAVAAYEKIGFTPIAPFGPYVGDPYGLCYALPLSEGSPLAGARLRLAPLRPAWARELHRLMTHPKVRRFLWDNRIIARAETEEIIAESRRSFHKNGYGIWGIFPREDGPMLGFAGLWHFFGETEPQLLFALHPAYWGRGFAVEAARVVMDYAYDTLDFKKIRASCDVPNSASTRVLERLGMERVHTAYVSGKALAFFEGRFPSCTSPKKCFPSQVRMIMK